MSTESVYCEPRELLPYSTSDDSDEESESNKCKKFRRSIPLPPKPGDSLESPEFEPRLQRATPPPPYYPSRQAYCRPGDDSCEPSEPAKHSYANDVLTPKENDEGCYFLPISDEEAELIDIKTRSTNSLQDNLAFGIDSIYLHPNISAESEASPAETIELSDMKKVSETDELDKTSDDKDVMYAIRRKQSDV